MEGKENGDLWLLADWEFLCNSPFKPSLSGVVETHLNLKRGLHTSPASRHQTSGAYKLVSTWAPCHIGASSPTPHLPHFYRTTLSLSSLCPSHHFPSRRVSVSLACHSACCLLPIRNLRPLSFPPSPVGAVERR